MKKFTFIFGFLLCVYCFEVDGQITTVSPNDSAVVKRNIKSKVAIKKNKPVSSLEKKKPIIKKGDLTYIYDPKLVKYVLMKKPINLNK